MMELEYNKVYGILNNPDYVKFKLSWGKKHLSIVPYEQHSKKTAILFMGFGSYSFLEK